MTPQWRSAWWDNAEVILSMMDSVDEKITEPWQKFAAYAISMKFDGQPAVGDIQKLWQSHCQCTRQLFESPAVLTLKNKLIETLKSRLGVTQDHWRYTPFLYFIPLDSLHMHSYSSSIVTGPILYRFRDFSYSFYFPYWENGCDYFVLFLSQPNLISGLPGGVNSLLSMHSTRALQTDGQTEKQSQ